MIQNFSTYAGIFLNVCSQYFKNVLLVFCSNIQFQNGQYKWLDGWPLTYTEWDHNEPSENGCAAVGHNGWVDLDCSQMHPYFCKTTEGIISNCFQRFSAITQNSKYGGGGVIFRILCAIITVATEQDKVLTYSFSNTIRVKTFVLPTAFLKHRLATYLRD